MIDIIAYVLQVIFLYSIMLKIIIKKKVTNELLFYDSCDTELFVSLVGFYLVTFTHRGVTSQGDASSGEITVHPHSSTKDAARGAT